jgi:hypothetical protein
LSPGTCQRRRPSRRRRGAGPRTRRRGDPTGTITIASTTTGHPRRRMRAARGVSTRERGRRRAGRLRRSPAAERPLAPRPSSRWIRRKTRVRGTLPRVRGN